MAFRDTEMPAKASKESATITTILTELVSRTNTLKRQCSMSVNPYDTSWVAMIARPSTTGDLAEWLFPQCYDYLLENQAADGSWYSDVSALDALLSTMAALLALLKHQRHPEITGCSPVSDLTVRISRAVSWLESTIRQFDLEGCTDNVGFEILIPSLLRLLGEYGVVFDMPQTRALMRLADDKSAKVDKLAQSLYNGYQATALHSLEAFIGKIDFDRLRGCKRNGGMLGSPSSTAAYLMHVSEWDDEAERFLKAAFEFGQGRSNGGIGSAYPIEVFEMSWVSIAHQDD
jgi:hypothetical protein